MAGDARQLMDQAQVIRQFNRFYTVHLGLLRGRYLESDFSLSEGRILYELSMNPASTANALRQKLDLDAGYMSRLLRSLTERALVQGSRSEQDRRATLLSLTEAGLAAVADLNQRSSAETMRMLDQLAEPQRGELLAALRKVQQLLSPPQGAAAPVGDVRVVRATAAHFDDARRLLYEYFDVIDVVLRDDEAAIRAALADPAAAMWIAYVDGQAAACVALRALPAMGNAVECKRLYVGRQFRRRGLAETLMAGLESHAAAAGVAAIYLDTKDDLQAAIALYQRLGYTSCARYNDNPQATVFMRKQLPVAVKV